MGDLFSKLLSLKPKKVDISADNPGIIQVVFENKQEAERFKRFLPRAGTLIPFVPAQLNLYPDNPEQPSTVYVERQIPVHLVNKNNRSLFLITSLSTILTTS